MPEPASFAIIICIIATLGTAPTTPPPSTPFLIRERFVMLYRSSSVSKRQQMHVIATLASVIAGAVTAPCAVAVDTSWTNSAGNNLWNDPANWSAGVPTINDRARVFAGGGTITWDVSGAKAIAGAVTFGAPRFNIINGVLKTDIVDVPGLATISLGSTIAAATPGTSITLLSEAAPSASRCVWSARLATAMAEVTSD